MKYSVNYKTNSCWMMTKSNQDGRISFCFSNDNGPLVIKGRKSFVDAKPVENGYGVVVLMVNKKKQWHIFNESGKVVRVCVRPYEFEQALTSLRSANEHEL